MHVAIIGNGITGITAALRIRALQPDWRISIISGESRFHYSRPALMYIYMGHMRYEDTKPYEDSFWDDQRLDLVRDWVTALDPEARELTLHRGGRMAFDRLLLATGSKSNRFGWKGEDLPGVQGLYDLMDLRALHRNTRDCDHAVIVGGGLIGIELAEMLHTQRIGVTFLVRERSYWGNVLPPEESAMVNRVIERHGFDLRLATELEEIQPRADGRVGAVLTNRGERIECQLVGLTAGVSPNLDLVRGTSIETDRGVIVDPSMRTSADGIYAAGDCAQIRFGEDRDPLLQQVWYTGRAQGEVAGAAIAGHDERYEPGTWFNSAKFLDLEYQVYGSVNRRLEGERSLYWEHPDGQHALRLVHVEGRVAGVNLMGLRYRHRVCEQWIEDGLGVDQVLDQLADGHFDPEFFARHEPQIRDSFREQLRTGGQEVGA